MLVNISELPKEIKKKLPNSIRLLKKPIELTELPELTQYEITNFFNNRLSSDVYIQTDDVYDLKPVINTSNDLYTLSIKKELLVEYLKNYFAISYGTYPFDPEFGNKLKRYLQTKNSMVRETLINDEVTKIIDTINTSFHSNIQVSNMVIKPVGFGDRTEYRISIDVLIENDIDHPIKETLLVG